MFWLVLGRGSLYDSSLVFFNLALGVLNTIEECVSMENLYISYFKKPLTNCDLEIFSVIPGRCDDNVL